MNIKSYISSRHSYNITFVAIALSTSLAAGALGQETKKELFLRVKPETGDLTPQQQNVLSHIKSQRTTANVEIIKVNQEALADTANPIIFNLSTTLKTQAKLKQRPSAAGVVIEGVTAAPTESVQMVNRDFPDLVIDDGLHTAEEEIATMRNFLPHVKPGGLYIVEDVELKDVKFVSAVIEQIRPGCIYVPDMRPEPWAAIAIRTLR